MRCFFIISDAAVVDKVANPNLNRRWRFRNQFFILDSENIRVESREAFRAEILFVIIRKLLRHSFLLSNSLYELDT